MGMPPFVTSGDEKSRWLCDEQLAEVISQKQRFGLPRGELHSLDDIIARAGRIVNEKSGEAGRNGRRGTSYRGRRALESVQKRKQEENRKRKMIHHVTLEKFMKRMGVKSNVYYCY